MNKFEAAYKILSDAKAIMVKGAEYGPLAKGHYAYNSLDEGRAIMSAQAVRFCTLGAIRKAELVNNLDSNAANECINILASIVDPPLATMDIAQSSATIINWNDLPTTTTEIVIMAIDKAMATVQEKF